MSSVRRSFFPAMRRYAPNEKARPSCSGVRALSQDTEKPTPVVLVSGLLRVDPDFGVYDVDTFATRGPRFASICRAQQQQPRGLGAN